MNPARNDPCPCGSGKKFKKCCGAAAQVFAARSPEGRRAAELKGAEQELFDELLRFARAQGGADWLQESLDNLGQGDAPSEAAMSVAVTWMLFHQPFGETGPPIARLFLDLRRRRLTNDQQSILEAYLASWVSLWQVTELSRDVGEGVEDLLTGTVRFVHDVSSSRTLRVHEAILGAVVDCDGVSWFGGLHGRGLGPAQAASVITAFRRHRKLRARSVAIDRLRDPDTSADLINIWDDAVQQQLNAPPPRLTTTDGDSFEFTTDRFDFDQAAREKIISALEKMPDVIDFRVADGSFEAVVGEPGAQMRHSGQRVIGRIEVRESRIVVETQSTRRADALRGNLERHLGDLVRFRLRESKNVQAMLADARRSPPRRALEMDPGLAEVARQMKREYMERWVDESVPALGGLTPREAAGIKSRRNMLETLLRQMEYGEAGLPEAERTDFRALRQTLGMN